MKPIQQWTGVTPEIFAREILPAGQPAVFRGLVRDWPVVQAGRARPDALASYLKRLDRGAPLRAITGGPEIEGKFFYSDDLSGLNFRGAASTLSQALDRLLAHADDPRPEAFALQSVAAREAVPGFEAENRLDLVPPGTAPRLWLGARATVVAHYDNADNIACVAAGRRRFTLFPPDQVGNLYPGPFELTPAGAVVSLADPAAPDLERHPRFARALEAALTAELEPGDAVYIPYLWWHDVRSLEPVNLLVNYWWSPLPAGRSEPRDALLLAILTIKALPEPQRSAWRAMFDHYVFERDGPAGAHLPAHRRGVLGDMDDEMLQAVRASLAQALLEA